MSCKNAHLNFAILFLKVYFIVVGGFNVINVFNDSNCIYFFNLVFSKLIVFVVSYISDISLLAIENLLKSSFVNDIVFIDSSIFIIIYI